MGAGNLFSGKTVSYNIKECVCFSKAQIKIFCSVIIVEAAVIPNNLNRCVVRSSGKGGKVMVSVTLFWSKTWQMSTSPTTLPMPGP